jgi:glycosyltransferase involved in cell wall biosynthesis
MEVHMRGIRFVHVVEAWDQGTALARYVSGIMEEAAVSGAESHLVYGEASGAFPDAIQNHWHVRELSILEKGSRQFRNLVATLEVLKPQVIWLHNIGCHALLQKLNRPDRCYSLWQHVHNHNLTCLTGCRLRRDCGDMLCREPLSIRCFSEIDAGQCHEHTGRVDRAYLFTDYIARLNLLLAMQKLDCVTVQNEYMKEVISLNLPHSDDEIHVIPGMLGNVEPESSRSGTGEKRRKLLYHGPIDRATCLHHVIDALSNVYADCPITLSVKGECLDVDYLAECREIAVASKKKNKTLSIVFETGEKGLKGVTDYRGYEVVVLASALGEVSSVEAARATLQGAAVIAACPMETGLSIPVSSFEKDVNSIAETIWTLLVDEDLRSSMVKEASRLTTEYFSPERQKRLLADLVEECSSSLPRPQHALMDG